MAYFIPNQNTILCLLRTLLTFTCRDAIRASLAYWVSSLRPGRWSNATASCTGCDAVIAWGRWAACGQCGGWCTASMLPLTHPAMVAEMEAHGHYSRGAERGSHSHPASTWAKSRVKTCGVLVMAWCGGGPHSSGWRESSNAFLPHSSIRVEQPKVPAWASRNPGSWVSGPMQLE